MTRWISPGGVETMTPPHYRCVVLAIARQDEPAGAAWWLEWLNDWVRFMRIHGRPRERS